MAGITVTITLIKPYTVAVSFMTDNIRKEVDDMSSGNPAGTQQFSGLPRLYTRAEVAKILGVSSRTVERLTKDGIAPHHKIGHLVKYTQSDIEKTIENTAVNHG